MAQMVKRLSTLQKTWVQSLVQEDSLEKEIATHSSTLAWIIPWMEEPGAGYCPWGRKESDTTERFRFTSLPVAQSCLSPYNPMDCSLPGFSVHEIFQARALQWVAISFSRESS